MDPSPDLSQEVREEGCMNNEDRGLERSRESLPEQVTESKAVTCLVWFLGSRCLAMHNRSEVLFEVVSNSGSKFVVIGKIKHCQWLVLWPFIKVFLAC